MVAASESKAQFDTAAISRKASVKEDTLIALFKRKDWNNYANYMHPSLIKIIGGKEKFVTVMQQAMTTLNNVSFDAFKNGRVLQIVQSDDQFQCVIESFMQMTLAGILVSGSSYDLAFSKDGEKWTFLRIDQNQTPETIKQLIPELSSDLKLPKSQFQQGKTMEEFIKGYRVEYMN
jgi:kynureninase